MRRSERSNVLSFRGRLLTGKPTVINDEYSLSETVSSAGSSRILHERETKRGKVVEDNHMPMARHGIASVSLFKSAIRGVKSVCDASFWKSRWSHLRFFNHGYLWVTSVIENPEIGNLASTKKLNAWDWLRCGFPKGNVQP